MDFMIYDIILLVAFVIFLSIFLYTKRKSVKKEGLLLLYKTSWGMKLIDSLGKKYKKTLKVLSYISLVLGYCLMGGILYLFGKIIWIYVTSPALVRMIKVPPIMPLIPYIDKIAPNLNLPNFYFIYWIIIIAVIAITHEVAHGIFMRKYNIKIKSTGFGFFPFFFPVFLAAFVEQDEKSMKKAKNFEQRVILSAGTFANVLTGILFFAIMFLFFSLAFTPSGVIFDSYAYSLVGVAGISSINGLSLDNPSYQILLENMDETGLNEIQTNEKSYLAAKDFLENQENAGEYVILYDEAPAIRENLEGAITQIDLVKIDSREKLGEELLKKTPGQEIVITTIGEKGTKEYTLNLGENPKNENLPWLGIGFVNQKPSGVFNKIISTLASFKNSRIYYEAKFDAAPFIYDLLWWIVLISFSVALINMLPVGIFDGGRFFYLTILAITKNEKIAKRTFAFMTYFFLFLLLVLMFFWAISFF
ncbi:site-2 protease family protein [Candidatus Pacearchaeota archaeon]|nr:site-2 protease family protein [Candidatus Pacearchaeota archaeon]